jgi:predicted regulator of Ras-like GTPase activity (Roadblock/LC7/MglB family)
MLATADGFVIESTAQTPDSLDFDSLAAEVAGVFRAANLIGRDAAGSPVRDVVLTLANGQTVLAVPISGEAIGVLLPQRGVRHDDAVMIMDRLRAPLQQMLEVHTGTKLVEAISRADAVDLSARASQPATGGRPSRIVLKGVEVNGVGNVATVRVSLGLDRRESAAKTVGRDVPGQRAVLAGEATIRAMLELLPPGHAVELTHLEATTPAREALWALTRFLSPDNEQSLFGIAPVQEGNEATSAAKAILNAVNRRIEVLLGSPTH